MTFAEINGKQVQVESLEGITRIRLDCEDVELTIESDSEVRDMAQLISHGGDRAPILRVKDTTLQVVQNGKYRTDATLRLPVSDVPPITGSHAKGTLILERVNGDVAVQHGVGTVRVERGHGALSIENGKGDIAVRDRGGALEVRVGSGNVNLQRCQGVISTNLGKGDLHALECEGNLQTKTGSGNAQLTSCSGALVAKTGSGDIYVNRPQEQSLSLNTASGNVLVRDGSVVAMSVRVARGDISSSARLHQPPDVVNEDLEQTFEAAEIELEGLEEKITRAVEEAMGRGGTRLAFSDLGFEANDQGVRITRGGVPVFEAGDHGVRFKKGGFHFEASDAGVRIKHGVRSGESPAPPGVFELESHSGNISLDVPYGAPMRVEALVTSGEVRSDVPLVTVGRPGPRGSTQRFVGGTTPGDEPRMSLRLKTDRGDIRVRAVHTVVSPPRPPQPPRPPEVPRPPEIAPIVARPAPSVGPDEPTARVSTGAPVTKQGLTQTEREERMQAILESLAGGSLSVAEAERLLAELDE